jgi:hypothetical protein
MLNSLSSVLYFADAKKNKNLSGLTENFAFLSLRSKIE